MDTKRMAYLQSVTKLEAEIDSLKQQLEQQRQRTDAILLALNPNQSGALVVLEIDRVTKHNNYLKQQLAAKKARIAELERDFADMALRLTDEPRIHTAIPDEFQRLWQACVTLADKVEFGAIVRYLSRQGDQLAEKDKELERLKVAATCLTQAVRVFAGEQMSDRLSAVLILATAEKEDVKRFVAMCVANDNLEQALKGKEVAERKDRPVYTLGGVTYQGEKRPDLIFEDDDEDVKGEED